MSKGTDRRTVRIAPELWEAARAVAYERGEPLSDVIRRGLLAYIAEPRALVAAVLAGQDVLDPEPAAPEQDMGND